MCGIFGNIKKSGIDFGKCREALDTLIHRGPDQSGEFSEPGIYIGHRRLSIIDLSENGRQPMTSEKTVISINGEIYNYLALKYELEVKYEFKSNSDSEIILHGFEEWGIEGLLNRIDGMYALVVFDKINKKLYMARDRYGIKPLYYSDAGGQFLWASELKAIVKSLDKNDTEIDHTAIYDYLTYLYIPTPKTLYKNVFKLAPAHLLIFDIQLETFEVKKYWDLPVEDIKISLTDACKKVRRLVSQSVKEQMISDVPLGFFLSGGIDSSIVVAEAAGLSNNVNTYSIGFDIVSHNETEYAGIIAEQFHTKHHEKILKQSEAEVLVKNMILWYDEPFADTSAIPSYLVSQFAKKGSTVVLTGDGGDELFGGYDWYQRFKAYSKTRVSFLSFLKKPLSAVRQKYPYSLPGRFANQLEYRICNDLELYAKLLGGMLRHEKKNYRRKWNIPADYDDYWYFRKFDRPDLASGKRLQYLDFHTYMHDDIFTKVDRVSMAVSLECRVPFMKRELVEFAFSLPEEITYAAGELKGLLKVAYQEVLPSNILYRKKRGFNIPLKQWSKEFLKNNNNQQEFILELFQLDEK